MAVPRPVIVVGVVLAAGIAAWLLAPRGEGDVWLGYVEGEALYVAAPVSGTLAERPVERGGRVRPGALLFELDPRTADAGTAGAAAQVANARAQLADMGVQRDRRPEIAVYRATEASARAQLAKAEADYSRYAALYKEGFASRTDLDAAIQARDVAKASVAQAIEQQHAGQLTVGRRTQRAAAEASVNSAAASLSAEIRQRQEIAPVSPANGEIQQVYFNPGEWVPANQPVVAVLPDDKRKLRFYVPQARIAALRPGTIVHFSCDGCGGRRSATVRYIAPRAEFTPPVIYSERARARLVFMIEASLPPDQPLPVGLPVAVEPQ